MHTIKKKKSEKQTKRKRRQECEKDKGKNRFVANDASKALNDTFVSSKNYSELCSSLVVPTQFILESVIPFKTSLINIFLSILSLS